MATRESRSEAWRGVFLISDGDLDYFDRDHDGFTSESSVDDDDDDDDDNGSPASPCIQNTSSQGKMLSMINTTTLGQASALQPQPSSDEESQSSESEAVLPKKRHSIMGVPSKQPMQPESDTDTDTSTLQTDCESSSVSLNLPDSDEMPRTQENHLYVTDSWLFKGIKEHTDDLHFSDVVIDSDKAVTARSKVDVLGEYTFIETTPTQRKTAEMFPAVYVPGNAYNWKTVQHQTNLQHGSRSAVMSDEHHARQPNFPYEPTLRALLATQTDQKSETNMRTVEIFTDAQVLTQLFTLISEPSKIRPFRLELSTVRNTLFLELGRHHGEGHTHKGGPVKSVMPVWAGDALRRVGFEAPRLPFSGGHYRVVRYRLGGIVCAVRSKVDFTCEGSHKKSSSKATFDPLRGVQPETIVTPIYPGGGGGGNDDDNNNDEENKYMIETWRTTVKHLGVGTKPDQTGRSSLRFAWESDAAYMDRLMTTELPMLWFSRTAYLLDTILSQNLSVLESKLRCVRGGYYRGFEHAHQADLRLLSALLLKMKQVTRSMGGTCVLVCDPLQRCFMVMKPVVKKSPVPEEIVVRLWGADEDSTETEYESTAVSESSGLTTLRSKTPSGFTGWKLDDPKAGVTMGADHRHHAQKNATSRAIVNQWLGRHQTDDYGDDMDYDIDEFSSDELVPNDSRSHRNEYSSSEEDSDRVRYGADGSMDVNEGEGESQYDDADDEDSASEEDNVTLRRHASGSMDVDDNGGDYGYASADEEDEYEDQEKSESNSEGSYIYASIEHDEDEDGDEHDEEDGDEDAGDYGGSDDGECDTITEEGQSSTTSSTAPHAGVEDLEDSDMLDRYVSGWSGARAARSLIPEDYPRHNMGYMRYHH